MANNIHSKFVALKNVDFYVKFLLLSRGVKICV